MSYLENISYALKIAKGEIPGTAQISKFGRLTNIDTGDTFPKDLWNGDAVYSGFPTGAAETMEIFSSDATDTSVGTGAREVVVRNLLDENGVLMPDITVALNGTTPVSLGAQTYSRCSRVWVSDVGSGEANAGEITLRHTTTTTNIFALMPIGFNATSIMAYTVPAGSTLYVKRGNISLIRTSGSPGSGTATVRSREYGSTVFVSNRVIDIATGFPYKFENNGFMVFSARTDLKVTVENVSDNDTSIASDFDGYLIED
ncbi:hypothetical protein HN803_07680 [candidate division WWE3 bacterium]|nr:hypothetical protein [candidate division WWE3 bacterium]